MRRAELCADDLLPEPGPPPEPWPVRRLRIGDRDTRVRVTPATAVGAEPAAYVHGLGGSAQDWTDLAGLLAPWLAGEAIDLPGFGGSAPLARYSLPALADHVIGWLSRADRGPVHLIGNSLGGALCVRVAALRPDLVRSLTLVAPAMPFLAAWRSRQGRLVPWLWAPGAIPLAGWSMRRAGPAELTRESLRHCLVDPDTVPPARVAALAAAAGDWLATPWHPDAFVRTFRALVVAFARGYLPGGESLWRLARAVAAPTLVVWGRDDRLVPVGLAPRVAAEVPDGRLLILDRVGHAPHLEAPRTVARAVLGLLGR